MGNGWMGIHVELAEQSERAMVNEAQGMSESISNLAGMVSMLEEGKLWEGPDAAKFFTDFRNFLPKLRAASDEVYQHANDLRWRVDLQHYISD